MVIVFMSMTLVWVVIPIMIFFYESNPNLPFGPRLCDSIKLQLPLILIMLLLIIPSFFWLNTYYLPEKTALKFNL